MAGLPCPSLKQTVNLLLASRDTLSVTERSELKQQRFYRGWAMLVVCSASP